MSDLTAGRELDAMVAEKVFGCRVTREYPHTIARIPACGCGTGNYHGWPSGGVPPFSMWVHFAWLVVEKMREQGHIVEMFASLDGNAVRVRPHESLDSHHVAVDPRDGGMPLAICLASLKAVGGADQEKPE